MTKKEIADQIKAWKLKHGDVFEVSIEGKMAWLKKPDRKTLAFAMTKVQSDPLGFAEAIINNCWLGGDDELRLNDDYFLALSAQLDKLIETKIAEIKKL